MLICTSRRESVICLLPLVVVLCGYQIYEFQIGLRFILSLNSACKGIKLYLHEVLDSDIVVCNPLWFTMSNLHRYFEIKYYREIRAKKSLVEVDFTFLLVSRLVILKSRPMLPTYFCHVSFMKISISCLLKSIVSKYFKNDILSV